MQIKKHEGTAVLTYFAVLFILVINRLITKIDLLSVLYFLVLLVCLIKFIILFYMDNK